MKNSGISLQGKVDLLSSTSMLLTDQENASIPELENYNHGNKGFSSLYEILHALSPSVFNLKTPVIFDEGVENFIVSKSKTSEKSVKKWFLEYKLRSGYYKHLTEGISKYNFWGDKTGVLSEKDIEEIKSKNIQEKYADPTYDITFKMLFASEKHKNLLIDFANSLLGFTEEEKIIKVDLKREEAPLLGQYGIKSSVDVLCSTANGQTIALEMQRKHEDYFLSRTQYYMSKLFVTSMQKGFSDQYHKMIDKVYMIIIGKDAIFPKEIGGDDQYEFTVTPTIEELNQHVPDNKMYWKFFELKRFEKLCNNEEIGVEQSSSKYNIQKWLRFLIECGKKTEESIPDDIPEIIKEAYKVMKTANMNPQDYSRYQDEQVHEHFERLERESSIRKAEEAIKKAQSEGLAEGLSKGKAEGLAEGISVALKYAPDANLQEDFHITQEQENKIKQLEQKTPAPSDIEEILLSNWHIESLDHQQNTELLGTDDSHAVHDA
jgi:predicted transposase/invertase (TIGR01784 family)